MKKLVFMCFMVAALIAAMEKPAAIEGKWEGGMNGLKAVTVTVHETKGRMEGSVIFYVTRDDGQGKRVVGQDERNMLEEPEWRAPRGFERTVPDEPASLQGLSTQRESR